jgi:hypothetical protein
MTVRSAVAIVKLLLAMLVDDDAPGSYPGQVAAAERSGALIRDSVLMKGIEPLRGLFSR